MANREETEDNEPDDNFIIKAAFLSKGLAKMVKAKSARRTVTHVRELFVKIEWILMVPE